MKSQRRTLSLLRNVVHPYRTLVAHPLFRHYQRSAIVFAELYSLDGGRELPGLDAFARLHSPQLERVVRRTGE